MGWRQLVAVGGMQGGLADRSQYHGQVSNPWSSHAYSVLVEALRLRRCVDLLVLERDVGSVKVIITYP